RRVGAADGPDYIPHRADVRPQVRTELVVGQLGERLDPKAGVAVGDVHGQEVADLRDVDRDVARLARWLDMQLAIGPAPDPAHPVKLDRPPVLTEQVDLVAHPRK